MIRGACTMKTFFIAQANAAIGGNISPFRSQDRAGLIERIDAARAGIAFTPPGRGVDC
jgi:hypothetical protein